MVKSALAAGLYDEPRSRESGNRRGFSFVRS